MTIDQAMQSATAHHQAGRLPEAESLYRQILSAAPNHLDAAYQLALLYLQANHPSPARDLLEPLASAVPGSPDLHANLAVACRLTGDPARAIESARRAVSLNPSLTHAWNILAVTLVETGQLTEALSAWQGLINASPTSPEPWSNLGVTYERLGRLADAEHALRRAIQLNPRYAPAHNNLGATLAAQGRLDEALASHHAAIAADPRFPRSYVNLAHTALLAGRIDDALSAARTAVQLAPNDVDAVRNLAASLQEQGDIPAAIQAYTQAANLLSPASPLLPSPDGPPLPLIPPPGTPPPLIPSPGTPGEGQGEGSAPHAPKTNPTPPSNPALRELWTRIRLVSSTLLPHVYESTEDMARWRHRLTTSLSDLTRQGLRADLTHEPAPTLFPLAYHGLDDRPLMESFGQLLIPPPPDVRCHDGPPRSRIRIGLISRFFRDHTIGRLNLGLVQHLNRDQFEVLVFSVGDPRDSTSQAFRSAADRYIPLPPQLAPARDLIAREACDILLYADLGMDPVTYSLSFSRLAPVQCATWGHPVTSGSPAIDYFISASHLEPPGSQSHYTERLITLPDLAVYYHRPTLSEPATRFRFSLDDDWTLYGCLQMLWKFHPDFDDLLAGVLRHDPAGRLLLIRGLNRAWDDALTSRWRRTMPDVLDRVIWLDRLPRNDFLALTSLCDVMLDPIHFCGGNTSYESFALGVPVITLPSPFLRGRLTCAMCRQIHLPECIALSKEDYIPRAISLAQGDLRHPTRQKLPHLTPSLFSSLPSLHPLEQFLFSASKGRDLSA